MTKEQFITEFCRLADLSESFFHKHMHAAYSPELGWHVTEKPEEPISIVKFKKLHPEAIIPARASDGAAGFDITCAPATARIIKPGETVWLDTGIAPAIPKGWVGQIRIRSSLAYGYGLEVVAGVIDADFRGEIRVGVINHGEANYLFNPKNRIAQMIVVPCLLDSEEVDDLDSTDRGTGGFGSTGAGATSADPDPFRRLTAKFLAMRAGETIEVPKEFFGELNALRNQTWPDESLLIEIAKQTGVVFIKDPRGDWTARKEGI